MRSRRTRGLSPCPVALLALFGATSCAREGPGGPGVTPSPEAAPGPGAVADAAEAEGGAALVPPPPVVHPNPFDLPAVPHKLDANRRVFTFSERMLARARLGATLVLYGAEVESVDGDHLMIAGRAGPSYRVHSAYVIPIPEDPRARVGDPVIVEHNGVMKHGVVKRVRPPGVYTVRLTDHEGEGTVRRGRLLRQAEGLVPGNYAARRGEPWQVVLLVSPAGAGRFFALGYGGAAMVVLASELRPLPVRPRLKPGSEVWAEWLGSLRPGVVAGVDDPGRYTVKFARGGGSAVAVGFGLLTPPLP